MRLVLISDTHTRHEKLTLPKGDGLIHCGDGLGRGSYFELLSLAGWLKVQPHPKKYYVPGNHDVFIEENPEEARKILAEAGVIMLLDEAADFNGVKIYGSPWQPEFNNWSFNLPRGAPLKAKWDLIPEDTEILITHGPPQGIMDEVRALMTNPKTFAKVGRHEFVGCEELMKRIDQINPRVHAFGHIHEQYGYQRHGKTLFINASNLDDHYDVVNKPIVIEKLNGK